MKIRGPAKFPQAAKEFESTATSGWGKRGDDPPYVCLSFHRLSTGRRLEVEMNLEEVTAFRNELSGMIRILRRKK